MDQDDFIAHLATFQLDGSLPPTETVRMTTTGTLAYAVGLPSVDLGKDTNPEFKLGGTLGEGGMGLVRTAEQLALRREVAVKTLRPSRVSAEARAGLLHEALVTGGLEHPNIVPIYSLGQTGKGDPVIVMKRIDGVAWSEYIASPHKIPDVETSDSESIFAWHLDVFGQICRAVHYAHSRGVLHRDIKPENVMIGAFGEVYLVDWGIAASLDPSKDFLNQVIDSKGICGTPGYMAPELTTGLGEDQGPHTDVFLLGSTLYHVLSGREPFRERTLFETMFAAHQADIAPIPDVPEELFAVIRKAMSRDPKDRYQSADILRRTVAEARGHRASRLLCDEATFRLGELQRVVESSTDRASDDARVRGLAGECRFGFEQASKAWAENEAASAGRDAALKALATWEIAAENIGPARALLNALSSPDPTLERDFQAAQATINDRDANFEELRARSDDADVSRTAGTRAWLAFISVMFWITVPLASGYWVRRGFGTVNAENYLLHGAFVCGLLLTMVIFMHHRVEQNLATRRLVMFSACFALWIPAIRLVQMGLGVDIVDALTIEMASYGLMAGGLAALSDRRPYFPTAVYVLGAALAVGFPYYVYEWIALSNLLGAGWLVWIWRQQSVGGELER